MTKFNRTMVFRKKLVSSSIPFFCKKKKKKKKNCQDSCGPSTGTRVSKE